MTEQGRKGPAGRKVFIAWLAASALYIAVIGLISIGPISSALRLAKAPPPAAAPDVHTTGPIHTPESPATKAAEIVGRQAVIALAPPLLLLWFGWDLWFAIAGLMQIRRERRRRQEPPAGNPS